MLIPYRDVKNRKISVIGKKYNKKPRENKNIQLIQATAVFDKNRFCFLVVPNLERNCSRNTTFSQNIYNIIFKKLNYFQNNLSFVELLFIDNSFFKI